MEIALSAIKIGSRIRKEMGDLGTLAKSMEQLGLLHPIIIDSNFTLLSGVRRLRAAEKLGWKTIEARMIDQAD